MKVKELIAELEKQDPELDVLIGCSESGAGLADILDVDLSIDAGSPCVVIHEA